MKNIILGISTIVIVVSLVSCGGKEEEKKPAEPEAKSTSYTTMALEQRQISGNVQLPGELMPFQIVQLFPKISGFVKTIPVDRGSVVRQGQLLATLEAPEVEQQVAAAKLRFTQAQATYLTSKDRYHRMLETSRTPGTISPFDLEAARSKMEGDSATAQGEYASYRAQEAQRSYLTITAPFAGVITERNVHPGALVGPGAQNAKPMLVLQQLSRLRLVVNVPEQYSLQVKNGDKVQYRANAIPGKEFTGTVSRSSQSLNSKFRAETIEIDVPNDKDQFQPGMFAEVILPTSGSTNAYVVPKSAVVSTTEKRYVIAVENGAAKWVDISEGNQSKDSTEIFGNLHDGTEVVVNASYQIKDGQKIK